MKRVISLLLILVFTVSLASSISPVITQFQNFDSSSGLKEVDSSEKLDINEDEIVESARELMMSQFSQNQGQIENDEIIYYGRFSGGVVGFALSKVLFWFENTEDSITMSFLGAKSTSPIAEIPTAYQSNYILGEIGAFVGVHSFSKIVYANLYPGIDLEYSISPEGVKYQFLVSPYAEYQDIQVQYEGCDACKMLETEIRFENDETTFTDSGLVSYQGEKSLKSRFLKLSENTYGFKVQDYDKSQPLVIDPLIHSTIISSEDDDVGYGITTDYNGFVYVTGCTNSATFPTKAGLGNLYSGNNDAFILKYELSSGDLIFSTFIGGSGYDASHDVAVDGAGNIHLVGVTGSPNFPSVNAADDTLNGSLDGFFLKLNSDGTNLLYSSYLGGTESESCLAMQLNVTGYVHLTGWTNSSDFTIVDPVQASHGGARDMIVTIIDPLGNVTYSSYYGGINDDVGEDIECDSYGNIFIFGTVQAGWPTLNAMNATCNGGSDFGICKLNPSGDQIHWATYVGGSDDDFGQGIAIDSNDDVCIGGYSNSTDIPTIAALNASNNGGFDAVVMKVESDGSNLIFSSYLGGTEDDFSYGLAVDRFDYVYVIGETFSTDFPILNAVNDSIAGLQDSFLCKLNKTGANLLYSTFFGGSNTEHPCDIALDTVGTVYITGWTNSTDFLETEYVAQSMWLPDWNYRKSHTIIGTVGAGSNYQIKLTVHYGTGTDSGDNVYLSGACQPDFDDVRFTDDDGVTSLGYWREEYTDSANATFWVKVNDNLDSDQTIYIYYGNSEVDTTSDGDATFILFDDFSGTSLNTSKWEVIAQGSNTYDVSDGELHADIHATTNSWSGFRFKAKKDISETNYLVHVESRWQDYDYARGRGHVSSPFLVDNDNQLTGITVSAYGDWYVTLYTYVDGTSTWHAVDNIRNGNAVFDYRVSGGDYFNMLMTGTFSRSYLGTISGFSYPFNLYLYATLTCWTSYMYCDVYYDIVYIQKYTASDPTHGGWGMEEVYASFHGGSECFSIIYSNADDEDSDGLTNLDEIFYGTNWLSSDTDGDLILDSWEVYYGLDPNNPSDANTDPDNDDLVNLDEFRNNTLPNCNDTDLDTIPDGWEVEYGLNPLFNDAAEDPDLDGVLNVYEYLNGTNPFSEDTDQDLMPDGWELENSLNPLVNDSADDPDHDNLSNIDELLNNCDPQNNDTDSDLMPDGWELENSLDPLLDDSGLDPDLDDLTNLEEYQEGTDPYDDDCDDDTLTDGIEVNTYGTNPLSNDTDSDLMPDDWEIQFLLNPLVNDSAVDGDGDLLTNLEEYNANTDPNDSDSDDDLLSDGLEVKTYLTDPNDSDSDNDLMPDGWEVFHGLNALVDDSADDLDGDTLSNYLEYQLNSYPNNSDTDADLMPDGWEYDNSLDLLVDDSGLDPDSDFLINLFEYGNNTLPMNSDTDADLLLDGNELTLYGTDPTNPDTDFDLMLDGWEIANSLDPLVNDAAGDFDLDTLSNYLEYTLGWSPDDNDTDDDLMPDGWEYQYGLNGLVDDSAGDADGDLLTNLEEYLYGCSPISIDGDGDTLTDYNEIFTYGTDPGLADTDSDSLNDNLEILTYSTNPLSNDTDLDLMSDGYEVFFGLNPLVDDASDDLDSDGLTNYQESVLGTTPTDPDTDLDNLLDGDEVYIYGSNPFSIDSDADGITDFYEATNDLNIASADANEDKDSDGLTNYNEFLIGTAANNTDTDSDGPDDFWEYTYGFDPLTYDSSLDPDNDGLDNAGEYTNGGNPWLADTDSDSLGDGLEALVYFTNLTSNDTDSDLMGDGWEVAVGLNPLVDDSSDDPDGDTLTNLQECVAGTHPLYADCDNDGANDNLEILNGCDPLNPDTDNDFMPDGFEILHGLDPLTPDGDGDLDTDTLSNLQEYLLNTDPNDDDSDDDSVSDGDEYRIYNTSPCLNDTDSDSLLDGYEIFTIGSNPLSADSDNDLLSDSEEVLTYGTDPMNPDSDSDMLDDYTEVMVTGTSPVSEDTDGDTMTDLFEVNGGLNPLVDDRLDDLDGDTLSNIDEFTHGTDPNNSDSDNDSLSDGAEVHLYGSNPLSRDTDADTMPDAYEVQNGLNPTVDDRTGDLDSDGLTNYIEFVIGSNPNDADSDEDTMPDAWEFNAGLDPTVNDASEDTDFDSLTNLEEYELGTAPLSRDTDQDLMPDGWEHENGLDPLTDDANSDLDFDGLTNLQEYYLGLDPHSRDSDNDQLQDNLEVQVYGTDPTNPDSDADSILDGVEVQIGSDPLSAASGYMTAALGRILPIGLVAVVGVIVLVQVRRRRSADEEDEIEFKEKVEEFYELVNSMSELSRGKTTVDRGGIEVIRGKASIKLKELEKLSKSSEGARTIQGCKEYLWYIYQSSIREKGRS